MSVSARHIKEISHRAAGSFDPKSPHRITQAPILIGGPARVGKTTLSRRLALHTSAALVQLDHLLHAVCAVAAPESRIALEKAPSIKTRTPKQWLDELRERDRVLWQAAHAYVIAAQGEPIIIEGGLWPDWVRELELEHNTAFIVDTGQSADRLVEIARTQPQSWMAQRKWPEHKIRKWAGYNKFRSEFIAELAAQHDYPVFDIADAMGPTLEEAFDHLAATAAVQELEGTRP